MPQLLYQQVIPKPETSQSIKFHALTLHCPPQSCSIKSATRSRSYFTLDEGFEATAQVTELLDILEHTPEPHSTT